MARKIVLVDRVLQLKSSSRRVLLVGLVVIAAVAMYSWIIAPFSNQLAAAQQYESTLDKAIRKYIGLGTTLEAKRAKVEELTRESDRLQTELFSPDQIREFFASLQTTAGKAGCKIQSVSLVPEQRGGSREKTNDKSDITGRKAEIVFIGGYGDIIRFFKRLQSSQHKVWIDSMRMDIAGYTGKLKCQAVLTLYCDNNVELTSYE